MDKENQLPVADNCPSCGHPREGKFCAFCGEKKLTHEDLTFKKFALQALDAFTHFEGKFFKSFILLLFVPGKLTKEYLAGRRVKLMKPAQLYVIVALVFYFFFKSWDLFYEKTQYSLLHRFDPATEELVPIDPANLKGFERSSYDRAVNKSTKAGITLQEYILAADEKSQHRSKAFVFIIIPLLAFFIYAIGYKREKRFVPHLVHATHVFTFLLSAFTIIMGSCWLVAWLGDFRIDGKVTTLLLVIYLATVVYIAISLARTLNFKSVWAITGSTLWVASGLLVCVLSYRWLVSWFSLWVG